MSVGVHAQMLLGSLSQRQPAPLPISPAWRGTLALACSPPEFVDASVAAQQRICYAMCMHQSTSWPQQIVWAKMHQSGSQQDLILQHTVESPAQTITWMVLQIHILEKSMTL